MHAQAESAGVHTPSSPVRESEREKERERERERAGSKLKFVHGERDDERE